MSSNNFASNGGAINGSGALDVTDCVFKNNSALHGYGGGIDAACPLTLNNCVFKNNSAANSGGGISFYFGIYSVSGGISFYGKPYSPSNSLLNMNKWNLYNCVFENNRAINNGGAIDIGSLGHYEFINIVNCTIVNNSAADGKALSILHSEHNALRNCIIRNGTEAIKIYQYSMLEINHCDIQNGYDSVYDPDGGLVWGIGNIDVDPLFADPNNDDYHLKSQAGRFDPNRQSWVQDDVTSLCIDAGDPNSPIGYEPFPNGGYINMGAYGGTTEASKSYFGEPICETIVAGDINGDCKVDETDLEILMLHWLEER
jgi:predicted outer membrane repeat protein